MSIEYFAPVVQNEVELLPMLFRTLVLEVPIEVLSIADDEVRLRWTNIPPRSDWPEDVTVFRDANGIIVSFHSGTVQQRHLLINSLSKLLLSMTGTLIEFEEI